LVLCYGYKKHRTYLLNAKTDACSQIKIMNLPHLIKTGESDTVEFKEKLDERTIESAVAFANIAGGCLIIGAEVPR